MGKKMWRDEKMARLIEYDELMAQTPRALLLRWDTRKEWIPESQVVSHDPDDRSITLKYWIVEQKDLEDLVEEEFYDRED